MALYGLFIKLAQGLKGPFNCLAAQSLSPFRFKFYVKKKKILDILKSRDDKYLKTTKMFYKCKNLCMPAHINKPERDDIN